MYDKNFYRRVYDLLVSYDQIKRDRYEKERFATYYAAENGIEWRFCGSLGFGGKFYHNCDRHYVSYYIEDKSRERERLVNTLNDAITHLEAEYADKG